jgi:hypothetical protein
MPTCPLEGVVRLTRARRAHFGPEYGVNLVMKGPHRQGVLIGVDLRLADLPRPAFSLVDQLEAFFEEISHPQQTGHPVVVEREALELVV